VNAVIVQVAPAKAVPQLAELSYAIGSMLNDELSVQLNVVVVDAYEQTDASALQSNIKWFTLNCVVELTIADAETILNDSVTVPDIPGQVPLMPNCSLYPLATKYMSMMRGHFVAVGPTLPT
jgi:hypothetical protein